MEYLSIKQTSEKWGISVRRIQILCSEDRIPGATKIGSYWAIPADAEKPEDQRIRSGKYVKREIGACIIVAKDKSGYVSVEFHPEWLDYIVPERFNNADLNRIVTFFVFHSPCSELSAMSKSLVEYGWNAPWRKPQYLQRRLKAASTNADLLFSAETIDDMRQALEKAELLEDITANIEVERIAVYNNKKNQFMSVFYHLRDAFAHGRLNMVDIGLEDDYVFIFEDVTKRKELYKVTARMILRKSTLIKWIDLIEAGYVE